VSRPIAVLLEIENDNHNADRCFAGLDDHFTLGVRADDVRDDSDPRATAKRILDHILRHRNAAATKGFDTVAVATHEWQTWRDTIGAEVQTPFTEMLREHGIRPIRLGTEGCNEQFRALLTKEFSIPVG
jgi:hypothetical protein